MKNRYKNFPLIFLFAVLALLACRAKSLEAADGSDANTSNAKRVFLIDLPLPLAADTAASVQRSIQRQLQRSSGPSDVSARPESNGAVFLFRFQSTANPEPTRFGDAYDFAEMIRNKTFLPETLHSEAITAALVPKSAVGNGLLAILACDRILAGRESVFGNPTGGENLETFLRFFPKKGLDAAIESMLDERVTLFEAQTSDGTDLLTNTTLEQAQAAGRVFLSEPVRYEYPYGAGIFAAADLRRFDLIDALFDEGAELDEGDELNEAASLLQIDPDLCQRVVIHTQERTGLVEITGPITKHSASEAIRRLGQAANDCSLLILRIDSVGGDLTESIRIMNFLACDLDRSKTETVAWIDREALADSYLIAHGCDSIFCGPDAVLGGGGAVRFDAETIAAARKSVEEQKRLMRDGQRAFAAATADSAGAVGEQGVKEGLADRTVTGLDDLSAALALDGRPELFADSWIETLLRALAHPYWLAILLCVAFITLCAEVQCPGFGGFGIVSFLCFLLFFWATFLGGTAGWLELILFAFGVFCIVLEICVIPGFGICGISGGAAVLAAIFLAGQSFVLPGNLYQWGILRQSLVLLTVACCGMVVFGWFSTKVIAKRCRPVSDEIEQVRRSECRVDYADLLGQTGIATTRLVPSGKGKFGERLIDVLSDGDLIEAGKEIRVVEVVGSRVVVRSTK